VEIELTQTQPGDPYRLPLEIAIADKIEKVELTQKRQTFQLPVPKAPSSVVLDPNTWLLIDSRFRN